MADKNVEKAEVKLTKLYFPELGACFEVDVAKLQSARNSDRRGYATFPALDSEGEEVAIAGSTGLPVPVAILLNDTTVKSKGAKKSKRKMLS
jgi:hypothetical protein